MPVMRAKGQIVGAGPNGTVKMAITPANGARRSQLRRIVADAAPWGWGWETVVIVYGFVTWLRNPNPAPAAMRMMLTRMPRTARTPTTMAMMRAALALP